MTEDIETSSREPAGVGASSLPPASAGDRASPSAQSQPAAGASSWQERADAVQERAAAIVNERPEVGVGAAFGGGLILALILKRIVR